jgi:hypothetical protein
MTSVARCVDERGEKDCSANAGDCRRKDGGYLIAPISRCPVGPLRELDRHVVVERGEGSCEWRHSPISALHVRRRQPR